MTGCAWTTWGALAVAVAGGIFGAALGVAGITAIARLGVNRRRRLL